MKAIHIVVIIVLGVIIGYITTLMGSTSFYVTFEDAETIAEKTPNKEVHVVAYLQKEKPMVYDPIKDPDYFSFYAKDTVGVERQVIYLNSKPQDMERVERLVLIGVAGEGYFEAKKILQKCPSKYQEEVNNESLVND